MSAEDNDQCPCQKENMEDNSYFAQAYFWSFQAASYKRVLKQKLAGTLSEETEFGV